MSLLQSAKREFIYISAVGRTMRRIRHFTPDSTRTIVDIVQDHARERPNNIALIYQDRTVTYRALDEGANRYAHWALAQGVMRGDAVALLVENRPEFVMAWLGILKIGGIAALINTNLRGAPLAHSIGIANTKHVIVGAELAANLAEAAPQIESQPAVWITSETHDGNLDAALAASSIAPPPADARAGVTCKDKAFYIYTSGTTGLPKAANFTHLRMMFMMNGFSGGLNTTERDRMYNALPLYHTAGGVCALGAMLLVGGACIIRRKFSVSEFWDDCYRYRATCFQYIGELCRYLLNAPPHPHERDHQIRVITGNGLRAEIWPLFQQRFAIPKIIEFYGATEGNVSMLNYDGTVGAIGRIPSYMRSLITTRLVRFDIEAEMPVRGPDGLCIECENDEAGEAIGEITGEAGKTFDGYTKAQDTNKKILHDVFKKGDTWFRTGDLLRRDAHGYFYFVDRIGDTFRWKGENVSTNEVAEALNVVPGVRDANVYGVAIPGHDGRAGMAALVAGPEFDLSALAQNLARNLPAYAQPLFIRLQPEIEITGTFKLRKVDLVQQGFDPRTIADPLYVLEHGVYVPLDAARYDAIVSGQTKI
ncbi:MAG TPA: long-chain-acyl-CoA synthetase [Rhizomicrobium sp.]|jgi:fatty-acyl-CoA synthase|nr:long-chain-acyl-CoA synthetase [Rhizomicrobium sp.]